MYRIISTTNYYYANDINVGWSQLGYICARKILGTYIKITDGSGSIWNQLKIGLRQVENFFNLP